MDAIILLAVAGGFAGILLLGQLLAGIYFAIRRLLEQWRTEQRLLRKKAYYDGYLRGVEVMRKGHR